MDCTQNETHKNLKAAVGAAGVHGLGLSSPNRSREQTRDPTPIRRLGSRISDPTSRIRRLRSEDSDPAVQTDDSDPKTRIRRLGFGGGDPSHSGLLVAAAAPAAAPRYGARPGAATEPPPAEAEAARRRLRGVRTWWYGAGHRRAVCHVSNRCVCRHRLSRSCLHCARFCARRNLRRPKSRVARPRPPHSRFAGSRRRLARLCVTALAPPARLPGPSLLRLGAGREASRRRARSVSGAKRLGGRPGESQPAVQSRDGGDSDPAPSPARAVRSRGRSRLLPTRGHGRKGLWAGSPRSRHIPTRR